MPRIARTGKEPPISPSTGSDSRRSGLAASFGFAFAGLAAAWRTQPNFRIHVVLAAAALVAGAVLRLPAAAWLAVVGAIGLVLTAELLNTAIEGIVDLVSPDYHPLAKRAKDCGAAAVLVASAAALATGILVVAWVAGRT